VTSTYGNVGLAAYRNGGGPAEPFGAAEVTAITPTGDRPATFALCRKWLLRQSVVPAQWIVVDDGHEPLASRLTDGADYIRRNPQPGEGWKSLVLNLAAALERIRFDKVLIIEDDDWYHPDYVAMMSAALDDSVLVGQGKAIYYNFPGRMWYRYRNRRHASLSQTGFRGDAVEVLLDVLKTANSFRIDMRLWRRDVGGKRVLRGDPPLCLGMKGLPGRAGLAGGHRPTAKYVHDPELAYIRNRMGEDVAAYEDLFRTE
jgi:hypothetical protein